VAILGIGAVVTTPVYQRETLVKRRLLVLALTTDHRVLDGAPSARFLRRVQDLIEQPSSLL
jgi:pyruvate/2-oxoglutarate dehydrogenase complex dihydrolipoamide acyltransferase (E2) component